MRGYRKIYLAAFVSFRYASGYFFVAGVGVEEVEEGLYALILINSYFLVDPLTLGSARNPPSTRAKPRNIFNTSRLETVHDAFSPQPENWRT